MGFVRGLAMGPGAQRAWGPAGNPRPPGRARPALVRSTAGTTLGSTVSEGSGAAGRWMRHTGLVLTRVQRTNDEVRGEKTWKNIRPVIRQKYISNFSFTLTTYNREVQVIHDSEGTMLSKYEE